MPTDGKADPRILVSSVGRLCHPWYICHALIVFDKRGPVA